MFLSLSVLRLCMFVHVNVGGGSAPWCDDDLHHLTCCNRDESVRAGLYKMIHVPNSPLPRLETLQTQLPTACWSHPAGMRADVITDDCHLEPVGWHYTLYLLLQDDTSRQRDSRGENKTTMSQLVKMQIFCSKHSLWFLVFSSFLCLKFKLNKCNTWKQTVGCKKQHMIENVAHFSVKLRGQRLMDKYSSALKFALHQLCMISWNEDKMKYCRC